MAFFSCERPSELATEIYNTFSLLSSTTPLTSHFPRDPFDLYHLKSQRSLDRQSIIFISHFLEQQQCRQSSSLEPMPCQFSFVSSFNFHFFTLSSSAAAAAVLISMSHFALLVSIFLMNANFLTVSKRERAKSRKSQNQKHTSDVTSSFSTGFLLLDMCTRDFIFIPK